MAQPNEALRVALAAAERLPVKLKQQLAQRLLESASSKQNNVTVQLRRLSEKKQSRLSELLDKNSGGTLSPSERAELKELGDEVDETMLSNSVALARAVRPELFDSKGRLVTRRFRQSAGKPPRREHSRR
jgi:hypothetical protein